MEHTVVSASKFNAWFGDNHVVKDVSIGIEKNQVIAVMGPSGCGKTTTGRLILQLIRPTRGEVFVKDSPNLATLTNKQL